MAENKKSKLDTERLAAEIRRMYSQVATQPEARFHFHRGADYAANFLGYDRAELQRLPERSTRSFAGVGNPHAVAPLEEGEAVLDIGSGAGTDLLIAAHKVGPSGRAIGVDFTEAMRAVASVSAAELGLDHVEVREGDALDLPVADEQIDVVISNGVLNLTPNKPRAFAEIVRVLRPGGRLQLADIIVDVELSEGARNDIDLWTG